MQKSAQLKADDMEAKDYRQHNIPGLGDMYTQEMYYLIYQQAKCTMSGENWTAGANISSRGAFNWWMNSESHRKAIQDPKYTKIGIGVGPKSQVAVQHFCGFN